MVVGDREAGSSTPDEIMGLDRPRSWWTGGQQRPPKRVAPLVTPGGPSCGEHRESMKRLLALVVPALLLLTACDDPSSTTPITGPSSDSPATSAAAADVAPSPTPVVVAPVAQPPADPYAAATAAGASAVCADGSWSYSKNRSGTCSSHGGVHWWTGNLGPAGPGAH